MEKQIQVLQSLNMITEYLADHNDALAPELEDIRALINLRLDRQHGAAPAVGAEEK